MANTSQEALQQIQSFDSSRANPTDVLNQSNQQFGVDQSRQRLVGLRGAIMGTENLLKSVDPSVTGRTSNSLVTEAQRSKMVQNERAPIADQYSEQQGALQNENANYNDLQGQAAKDAQLRLTADDTKRNSLQSLYDTLYRREQDALAAEAARKAAASGGSYGLGSYLGGSSSSAAAAGGKGGNNTDPVQQDAYNDVKNRMGSMSEAQLISDYLATAKSAGYGNTRDKYKVQAYAALLPNVVSKAYSPEKSGAKVDQGAAFKTTFGGLGGLLSSAKNKAVGNFKAVF